MSFTPASDVGVGAEAEYNNGKYTEELISRFTLATDKQEYYIAIKQCSANEDDKECIGIQSLYIIKANDWTNDYIFTGAPDWNTGIVIAG